LRREHKHKILQFFVAHLQFNILFHGFVTSQSKHECLDLTNKIRQASKKYIYNYKIHSLHLHESLHHSTSLKCTLQINILPTHLHYIKTSLQCNLQINNLPTHLHYIKT